MSDFLISLAKVGFAVGSLAVVLAVVSQWSRARLVTPELARKAIHVSLGLSCLVFPILFSHAWEGVLTCVLAIGVFALARGSLYVSLGAGLHRVKRRSHGEVYFAVSVGALFVLRDAAPNALGAAAFVLPVLVLTISDAAAALVGAHFGRRRFVVGESTKSWEGVAAFVATAFALSQFTLAIFSGLEPQQIALLSLMVALAAAAIEALSTRGLDNLFIPLGLFVALCATTVGGFDAPLALAIAAAAASVLAMLAQQRPVEVQR